MRKDQFIFAYNKGTLKNIPQALSSVPDSQKLSVLRWAITAEHLDIVKQLVRFNSVKHNRYYLRTLDWAITEGHNAAVQILENTSAMFSDNEFSDDDLSDDDLATDLIPPVSPVLFTRNNTKESVSSQEDTPSRKQKHHSPMMR